MQVIWGNPMWTCLKWLINIKPGSIGDFSSLVNRFYQQFASSRAMKKQSSDLNRIVQKAGETTRSYLDRYNKEMIAIQNLDMSTAIEAFRRGLPYRSRLYAELTRYPCSTFEEVQTRTLAEVRMEEDEASRMPSYNDRKAPADRRSWRHHPYSRKDSVNNINSSSMQVPPYDDDLGDYPDLANHCFNVDAAGVVEALQKLGDKVRWPRRTERPEGQKDKSRYCSYHGDHGHNTEDCYQLRRQVAYLLKKGHLDHLMDKRDQKTPAPPPPPVATKVINLITGGLEICGLSTNQVREREEDAEHDHHIRRRRVGRRRSP